MISVRSMDSINNMRFTSFKNNDFDCFVDFYISILIGREEEELKEICRINKKHYRDREGYVYAPYIPMQLTPIIVPTGLGKSNVMSRYSQTQVNENFYGRITVEELL